MCGMNEQTRRPPGPTVSPGNWPDQARTIQQGEFHLPTAPATALPLFTPEGERRWVDGWDPNYFSTATDEVGAVWQAAAGADSTWVTTDRTEDRVRYARISSNGTVGLVEVVCTPAAGGTSVRVTYDITACSPSAVVSLRQFVDGFADMLAHWQQATTVALAAA
jgi:hypothetical protein